MEALFASRRSPKSLKRDGRVLTMQPFVAERNAKALFNYTYKHLTWGVSPLERFHSYLTKDDGCAQQTRHRASFEGDPFWH